MLKIHQPYKSKYVFAFVSIGALLLGSLVVINSASEKSIVYATGDSRTIHDISDMQEMTQQICSNTDENDAAVLTDNRDGYSTGTMTGSDGSTHNLNQYVVVKLKDGNCWMQENLRLGSGLATSLTPGNTDITSDYTLPASSDSDWLGTDTDSGQMRAGDPDMATSYSNEGWKSLYGNYYSWCAATAGTCDETTLGDTNVSGSICPKNWRLPSGNNTANSQFNKLLNSLDSSSLTTSPYLFYPAGSVNGDSLQYPGMYGYYWSCTTFISGEFDAQYRAHSLFFSSKNILLSSGSYRAEGLSVRCIAPGGLEKIEKPTWVENVDGNVMVTMPSVISIDAASGMDKTADAAKVIEGTATATISSNAEYNISIHSTQPSLKDPEVSSAEISPVSESNPVKPGNNAWGLWDGSGDVKNKSYTLPITTTPQDLYSAKETVTNAEGNPATKHTYYVGISISPALPSGTYATDVIITASTK